MAIVFLFQFVTAYGFLCLKRLLIDIPASNSVFFLLIFYMKPATVFLFQLIICFSDVRKLNLCFPKRANIFHLSLL